jgi:hypothetical protein
LSNLPIAESRVASSDIRRQPEKGGFMNSRLSKAIRCGVPLALYMFGTAAALGSPQCSIVAPMDVTCQRPAAVFSAATSMTS